MAMHHTRTDQRRTVRSPLSLVAAAFVLLINAGVAAQEPATTADSSKAPPAGNPYPTPVIADYVLACMAANGNTYQALHQCSCSIDLIASKMPYEEYEAANTILQIQQDKGQRGIFYREANWSKTRVDYLKKLQAESTLVCF